MVFLYLYQLDSIPKLIYQFSELIEKILSNYFIHSFLSYILKSSMSCDHIIIITYISKSSHQRILTIIIITR